ncbi:hypothetical protein HMPREF9137_2231 [Prevotella denticola F0289]|nr:hypothetical protein HMPREF9137_2231 [Prevotella denticola F0289]
MCQYNLFLAVSRSRSDDRQQRGGASTRLVFTDNSVSDEHRHIGRK